MNTRQRRFVDEYLVDFHATNAAIRAGYSERSAHSIASENLKKPKIAEAIRQRVELLAVGSNERLLLLAEIARGGDRDSDRLRAIELLGKLAGDYVDKVEHAGGVTINLSWDANNNE